MLHKLICLVGMCGAGKSEVADYLRSKREFGFVRFGQLTLDVIKKMGVKPLDGGTLYCRMTPCPVCAKMIINCGIKRVVCQRKYHDGAAAEKLFKKCGVKIEHLNNKLEKY